MSIYFYRLGDYAVNMMIEGNPICLGLWDTASKLFFREKSYHWPATKSYRSADFQGMLNNLVLDKLSQLLKGQALGTVIPA